MQCSWHTMRGPWVPPPSHPPISCTVPQMCAWVVQNSRSPSEIMYFMMMWLLRFQSWTYTRVGEGGGSYSWELAWASHELMPCDSIDNCWGKQGRVHTGAHHKSSSWQLPLAGFLSRRERDTTMEVILTEVGKIKILVCTKQKHTYF